MKLENPYGSGVRLLPHIYLVGGLSYHLTYTDWPSQDCNVYVVDSRDGLILIDCGCGETFLEILANFKALELDPKDITHLLLTHAHIEHTGAAHALHKLKVKTVAHKDAAASIESGDEGTNWLGFHKKFVPCPIDQKLEGGEKLEIGEVTLEAFHAPGHAKGCLIYKLVHGNRVIGFTGDVIFPRGRTGARCTPDYDAAAYLDTLKRLVAQPLDILLPGHGPFCASRGHVWIEECYRKLLLRGSAIS